MQNVFIIEDTIDICEQIQNDAIEWNLADIRKFIKWLILFAKISIFCKRVQVMQFIIHCSCHHFF